MRLSNAPIPRSTAPPRSYWSWIVACLALVPVLAGRAAGTGEGERAVAPAAAPSSALDRIGQALATAYFARHPDEALRRGWPGARELGLGTFGAEAAVRWRGALTDALNELAELDLTGAPRLTQAQLRAVVEWLEIELMLLDGRSLSTTDPAGYVQRVQRTLHAAAEARSLAPEERIATLRRLLDDLPAYFRDARISLIAPAPAWIEVALRSLDDLQEEVDELERALPKRPAAVQQPRARAASEARKQAPGEALEGFRRWLLEFRPGAAGDPPRLGPQAWTRMAQLTSGARVDSSELKARCLRDLARLDCAAPRPARELPRKFDGPRLTQRADIAASAALALGQRAQLLRRALDPASCVFAIEPSLRTCAELVRIDPEVARAQRIAIQLPHPSWPAPRAQARRYALRGAPLSALGVRYGLAGEALFERARARAPGLLAVLPDSRMFREALGLYALDWAARVDWIENAFRADAQQLREFELQRGLEAARLIAALELHAEGLSVEEAALAFQRRTGVDDPVALFEALEAQRDPRRGLGYLGWLEVRALEERLAARTSPRKGLELALKSILRHPELRPNDLIAAQPAPRKRPR